jgi:5'-3' exonuclease
MTTVLIDGDIVAYRAAAGAQVVSPFDEDKCVASTDMDKMKRSADEYIERCMTATGSESCIVCLTERGREYRKELWPGYKAHRASEKPALLYDAVAYLQEDWPTLSIPTLEADDVMGIYGSRDKNEYIVATEDKDLKTVPCRLFNPGYPKLGIKNISKLAADRFFMWQTICGDTTDGYKGAIGVGPKSVFALLVMKAKSIDYAWDIVLKAYRKAGMSVHDALLNARLARILRDGEWDAKGGVKLWSPAS